MTGSESGWLLGRARPPLARVTCGVVLAGTLLAGAGTQSPPPAAIRILSPEPDSYISGTITLKAEIVPATVAVERVSLFADGRLVCAVDWPPYECGWDAGGGVREHVIRAVATIAGGQRLVSTLRTKGVGYAEAVEVHVVQVSVLVKDERGEFVSGLTASDFRLFEDDVLQRITNVADEDAPLEVVMALDISASMTGVIGDVRTSARTFIEALRDRDALTILGFNDNIFTVARRETRLDSRIKALDRLAPWGSTALYDVISRGVGLLQKQPGRKGLVVFSDGDDEASRLDVRGGRARAAGERRGDVRRGARAWVASSSTSSGGSSSSRTRAAAGPSSPRTMPCSGRPSGTWSPILSHQYVLSFVPSRGTRDGTWRTLKVEIPGKHYRIRARQGYRAREAP